MNPFPAAAIRRIGAGSGRVPLLRVDATRRLEASLAATLPPHTLMQRAGDAVARLALAIAPHARDIVVAAGPGNNGGDGFEAASLLRALGKAVRVVAVAPTASPPADAASSRRRAEAAGVAILDAWPADDTPVDLVVDALLGIGLSRPPASAIADAIARIEALRRRGCPVLAIDVPSGLDADGGAPFDGAASAGAATAVVASHTLALLAAKPGLFTHRGRDHAGTVWLAAIGADDGAVAGRADAWLVGRPGIDTPTPPLHASHKGTRGDVVVVGGAEGMVGAAVLAARAALVGGAGRVVVDCLAGGDAAPSAWPELMWRSMAADPSSTLQRSSVVAGCGGGTAIAAALPRLLGDACRLVLDADALNAVAADPALADALRARHGRDLATVLTPHPLEAARLAGSDVAAVQRDRVAAARDLAERFACVIVLKGSGTVIAAPGGGAPRIAATGGPALATAGTGDVLAGWLGGRWSRAAGSAPPAADALVLAWHVATDAVVEHGWAGEREGAGLTAGSLVERLARPN